MRYANKRQAFRGRGGRFTTPPTLHDMGIAVSDGSEQACQYCGHKQRPLLARGWTCGKCDKTQPGSIYREQQS